jgi:uncharacterized damage-inducible protein DinB
MESVLRRLFEHNNWANKKMIELCAGLPDVQLDADPRSSTKGSIRETLLHLVRAQQGYLSLLTFPVEKRTSSSLAFGDLAEAAQVSGAGLLALLEREPGEFLSQRLHTSDGYLVEPWVVLIQAINHAAEHREQISSMLSDLGIEPPHLDGWSYGESEGALTPVDV